MHRAITFLLAAAAPSLNSVNIKANDIGVPSASTPNISVGIANIVKLMMLVMGSLALIFLIVGGLQMIISTGNSSRVSRARETITYAIVGLVIAIAAYAIVTFVSNTFS